MNVPALLVAIAVGGAAIAVVTRPVSAFARRYVSDLEQAGAQTGAASPGNTATESATFHAQWLLAPASQGVLAALLCGVTLMRGAAGGAWGEVIVALPLVALLGAACSVDAVCHRLPNRLLGAAAIWLGAALIVRAAAGLVTGPAARAGAPPVRAVLCALGIGGAVLILALLPSGLGMGDVKLCALTGLWLGPLGWGVALSGVLAGVVLAGLSAIVLMAARVVGRKQMIAMGPHLIMGAWLAWLLAVRAGA